MNSSNPNRRRRHRRGSRRRQINERRERRSQRHFGHQGRPNRSQAQNVDLQTGPVRDSETPTLADLQPAAAEQRRDNRPEDAHKPFPFHFEYNNLDTVQYVVKRLNKMKGQKAWVRCANGFDEVKDGLESNIHVHTMAPQSAASYLAGVKISHTVTTFEQWETFSASERKRAHLYLERFRIANKIPVYNPPETVPSKLLGSDTCPGCNKAGHGLKQCIWPGRSGLIECCTVCNSKDHFIDECGIFNSFSEADRFHALITERINMPGVRMATTTWWEYVWSYVKEYDIPFFNMPWTISFTKQVVKTQCDVSSGEGQSPFAPAIGEYSAYLDNGIVMKEFLPQDPTIVSPRQFARFLQLE